MTTHTQEERRLNTREDLHRPTLIAGEPRRLRLAAPFAAVLLAVGFGFAFDSDAVALALAIVALLAASFGHAGLLLFCCGLSVTFDNALMFGIPKVAIFVIAVLYGCALNAGFTRRLNGFSWRLLLLTPFVATYAILNRPATNAGLVEALSLTLIPLTVLAMRWGVATMPRQFAVAGWFAAGCAVSVGIGLSQAYEAVGSDYQNYTNVRVFVSTIGSSNFAAGLSVIVGLLLLGLGVDPPRRRVWLIVVSTPFLAAPFVLASRGATVALVSGLVILALKAGQHRMGGRILRLWFILAGAVILAAIASSQSWFVWQRFTNTGASPDVLSGRGGLWTATASTILDSPILGIGPGRLTDFLMSQSGYAYSHNFYLEVLAQLGIPAGLIYFWWVRPVPMRVWTAVTPALIAIAVDSAVEPMLSTTPGAVLYAGLVAAHWSLNPARSVNTEREDIAT